MNGDTKSAHKMPSLTHQTAYLALARCLAFALQFMHPIILVRVFTKVEYGLYGQLLLICATLIPLAQMGMSHGLYYFVPREPEKKAAVITQTLLFVVGLSTLFVGLLLVFRSSIATAFHNSEMTGYLLPLGLYAFFMMSSSFLEASMIAEDRARLASFVIVGSQAAHSATVISVALSTNDIGYILYALVLFSFTRFVFQGVYLGRKYDLSVRKIEPRFWKRQLAYSIPIGLDNVSWLFQGKLHRYIVSFLFNAKMFAVYSIGSFNLPIVTIITASTGNVLTKELSRYQKRGHSDEILRIWNSAIRKMNLFLFPVFVFFFLMAEDFIIALFTANYQESITIFRISLLTILTSSINTGAILNAYAETRYLMKIAFLRLPVSLLILYVFTNVWGVMGAISANVLIVVSFTFFILTKVVKVLRVPFREIIQWKVNMRILLVAILSGFLLVAARTFLTINPLILLTITFPSYVLCYGLMSVALGTVSGQETMQFQQYFLDKLQRHKVTQESGGIG